MSEFQSHLKKGKRNTSQFINLACLKSKQKRKKMTLQELIFPNLDLTHYRGRSLKVKCLKLFKEYFCLKHYALIY